MTNDFQTIESRNESILKTLETQKARMVVLLQNKKIGIIKELSFGLNSELVISGMVKDFIEWWESNFLMEVDMLNAYKKYIEEMKEYYSETERPELISQIDELQALIVEKDEEIAKLKTEKKIVVKQKEKVQKIAERIEETHLDKFMSPDEIERFRSLTKNRIDTYNEIYKQFKEGRVEKVTLAKARSLVFLVGKNLQKQRIAEEMFGELAVDLETVDEKDEEEDEEK